MCASKQTIWPPLEVKSTYEPSGSSGRSLSRFQYHEVTRSISTLPEWDASPSQGYTQHLFTGTHL